MVQYTKFRENIFNKNVKQK